MARYSTLPRKRASRTQKPSARVERNPWTGPDALPATDARGTVRTLAHAMGLSCAAHAGHFVSRWHYLTMVKRQLPTILIASIVLATGTAYASAGNTRAFTVKEVAAAFAKQGITLGAPGRATLGGAKATALQQKALTGTGKNLTLHALDFVIFVFPTSATVNAARVRAAAQTYARHSLGHDVIRANLIVVWDIAAPNNGDEVARIKRAIRSLQG